MKALEIEHAFRIIAIAKMIYTGLRIDEHRFFLPTSTLLRHSALFCTVRFGAALRGATLRGWWKRTFTIQILDEFALCNHK